MKTNIFNICCLLLITASIASSCKKQVRPASAAGPAPELTGSTTALMDQLVWSDEFDGTSVNTANWNFEIGAGGWGNNEQQYYRRENATVSNGNLVITAKRERYRGSNYTSARLTTQNKRSFAYGRMEARIKLPLGQGLWPAFWMLGSNFSTVGWPKCGEIDIMEHINTEPTIYGTIHWDANGYASYGGHTGNSTPDAYHIYSIQWDGSAIKWFLDGVQFHEANILNSINSTEEFHKPFFFIVNLAVGGNWPGQTIDNSKFPASLYVDYIRVYQ